MSQTITIIFAEDFDVVKEKFNRIHMNICHLFLMSDQTNSPNIKYIETFDLRFAHLKYLSNCLSLVVTDKCYVLII